MGIYKCPPPGFGGCGRITRTAAPIDEYITALVLEEQSKIQLARVDELPPWERESELQTVVGQIKETTDAYKKRQISGGRYFPLMASLEDEESKPAGREAQVRGETSGADEAGNGFGSGVEPSGLHAGAETSRYRAQPHRCRRASRATPVGAVYPRSDHPVWREYDG